MPIRASERIGMITRNAKSDIDDIIMREELAMKKNYQQPARETPETEIEHEIKQGSGTDGEKRTDGEGGREMGAGGEQQYHIARPVPS